MPEALSISRATPLDAVLLARLHASCFDRPWNEEAMATLIAGPGTLCLLGFAGDPDPAPAGFLIVRQARDEAELLTIGVVPGARRSGIARALLENAADELRASRAAQLFLEVDESNLPALSLYRSLGAKPVGRRPGYYEGGADAAIFSLALSDPCSDDGPIADEPREDQR